MKTVKWGVFCGVVLLIIAVVYSGLPQYLTWDSLRSHRVAIQTYQHNEPLKAMVVYGGVYVLVASLSLPGIAILTMIGGVLFGQWLGTGMTAVAATIGATVACFGARYMAGHAFRCRFRDKLKTVNERVEKNGWNTIFFLRMIPLFPFFMVNILCGLSQMPMRIYIIGSFIAMLPATAVYTHAGAQLATIQTASEIMSTPILLAFGLMGGLVVLPMVINKKKSIQGETD